MVLLEEYYELNEFENVSKLWKMFQICTYTFAAVFGVWCGFTLGILKTEFDGRCYLYAVVKTEKTNNITYDDTKSKWGLEGLCEFCQYTMILSFIVGTLWVIFFLMCGKGGKSMTGLPKPWRIVLPALLFNFVFLIVILVAAIDIRQGTKTFCDNFDNDDEELSYPMVECLNFSKFTDAKNSPTLLHINIVSKTSWVCVVAWSFSVIILLLRIILGVDFHLYKVCVFRVENVDTEESKNAEVDDFPKPTSIRRKSEKIIKVVDYEENQQSAKAVKLPQKPNNKKKATS